MVKLNEGVSGEGNAIVDLRGLPPVAGSDDPGCQNSPATRPGHRPGYSSKDALC